MHISHREDICLWQKIGGGQKKPPPMSGGGKEKAKNYLGSQVLSKP